MIDTIFRMFPALVMASSFIYGLFTCQMVFVFFACFTLLSDGFGWILKHNVFQPLYAYLNTDTLPLLGRGPRPEGATNCSVFPDTSGKLATSFGMPSGHSLDACMMAMFWCLYIIYETNWSLPHKRLACTGLGLIALLVAQSRYRLGCHTIQQIGVGGIVGIVLGGCGFLLWKRTHNLNLRV